MAGGLFAVAQILNVAWHQETTVGELAEFFSRLFVNSSATSFNTFDFALSLLYYLIISMVIGISAVLVIWWLTKFSSRNQTMVVAVIAGVIFWLVAAQILEPKLATSFIFQHQLGRLEQLFIQVVVAACFGWLAQAVFEDWR